MFKGEIMRFLLAPASVSAKAHSHTTPLGTVLRLLLVFVTCFSLASFFSVTASSTPTAAAASGFLKASGTVLKDNYGTGSVVNLRGTNLGGWLLQEAWMAPGSEALLDRTGWTAYASSIQGGSSPSNAIDGNINTRWSSGVAQASGQWFKIDMGSQRSFDQLSFDAGSSTGDYPASILVQASSDGSTWWNVVNATGTSQNVVVATTSQTARYILVFLQSSKSNWWSIAEFNAYVSDQYNTYQVLTNRFGATTANSLLSGYHDNWIQASDLDNIKNMGMNVVRVPIYWEVLMNRDGSMKPDSQAFRELDWVVTQSAQRGIYVILDLHGTPGGDCPWQSCGITGSNQLWTNGTYQNWTVQIWQRLSAHYNGNATVAGYDLLNEPLLTTGAADNAAQVQQKFDFYNRLYQAVRAIDPDHLIIVAAFFGWDQALPPSNYGWSNVMYQVHSYDFGQQYDSNAISNFIDGQLQGIASHQQQWNVPVYAGEFWFGQFNDLTGKFLSGLNALNASWTNWAYKNKNPDNAVGPDGVQSGIGWGFYRNNPNAVPDINHDDAATIASKWSKFTTSNFQADTALQNVFATYAKSYGWSSIKAMANNQFVSADNAGANPLIANRTTAQGWEEFKLINNPDGTVSLQSMANNKYVTADLNQSTKLIAEAYGVRQWEEFKKIDLGNGSFALQSMANNQYVTCDLNTGSPVLYANRASVGGAWEAFVFSPM
jgi:aryl-phospho-beta-D-glucosidase BglC (GH1 family)